MELQYAVYLAIEECIRENVLREFLIKYRAEVIAMMLYDYDMEKHIKSEKAYEYERGMKQGTILMLRNLMQTMNITEAEAKKYLKLEWDLQKEYKRDSMWKQPHLVTYGDEVRFL